MCNGNEKVCKIWCEKKMLSYLARYKLSILMITLVKIELNIIKIGHITLIINTEY